MKEIIVASENTGKLEEIRLLLGSAFDKYYYLQDFTEKFIIKEDGPNYMVNAMKKARKIGNHFGICTIADDSGLEVRALQGRPGIYSSRYGKNDADRINKLLMELSDIPWEERRASFKAYVALYVPGQERWYIFFGRLDGYIGFESHGEGGFGYDPVFYEPQVGQYLAELTIDCKNAISHRGKALSAMKKFL